MTTSRRTRRAFSLIELMIVILIIALIIAIVIPALGSARKSARNAGTRALMVQVEQACSSFNLSERRPAGYFQAREMGDVANSTAGFTGMENVMFDLAGGVVTADAVHPAVYGPTPAHLVAYDGNMVGVVQGGSKVYFTPPSKFFKLQDGVEGGTKVANGSNTQYVRDLVDYEGTPLLFWSADPMAIQPIASQGDFARAQSTNPARFYWTSNGAFLKCSAVGDKRTDENLQSLLGNGNANCIPSLIGVLGNPSSPNNITNVGPLLLPTAPRGQFIIQAAGTNCTYVGREERGAKYTTAGSLGYDLNFRNTPSSDIMNDFDDIIIAGN